MSLLDLERIEQADQVINPIAHAARGVNQFVFGVAISAQVGRNAAEASGQFEHDLFPIGCGGSIAVQEQNWRAVFRSAKEHAHFQARGINNRGCDTW